MTMFVVTALAADGWAPMGHMTSKSTELTIIRSHNMCLDQYLKG